ncbi:MAG: hypothetical protein EXR21_00635 [Flavobacteriaceae bacterium]|nr:hypothetical protein [Flavobacteriaceae bacterium]
MPTDTNCNGNDADFKLVALDDSNIGGDFNRPLANCKLYDTNGNNIGVDCSRFGADCSKIGFDSGKVHTNCSVEINTDDAKMMSMVIAPLIVTIAKASIISTIR